MPQVVARAEHPGRRAVVVGGGPAGLEAARVLGERGHHIVLFEAAPRLGGQVLLGAEASWRKDLIGVVDWRAGELDRLGVDVRTSHYAEPEDVLAEDPEIVIVSTGGVPDIGWLDGVEHATSAWDFLTGGGAVGEQVLVYDGTGRHPALQCAERAATAGADVQLVCIDGEIAVELTYAERAIWKQKVYEAGVTMTQDHRLLRIAKTGNRLTATFANEATGAMVEYPADRVVVEHGTIPVDDIYQALRGDSANNGVTDLDALLSGRPQSQGAGFELHRIGDAVSSRNIAAAVYDALRLCNVM